MRQSIKVTFIFTVGLATGFSADKVIQASEVKNLQEMQTHSLVIKDLLSVGKVAGACNTLSKLFEFATLNKSQPAKGFIKAFIASESKRLGITIEGYINNCKAKDAKFTNYTKQLEALQYGQN
tara:strand:+ start:83 stop:451 length:369 start_codon:yes stop_codon:yes gene_type:complete